jgi:threonyl-tRNA synthetase
MAKPSINQIRHTLSHLLAHAVQDVFPDAKFGIGPVIDNGFYYDFELSKPLTEVDLKPLEKRMRHLIKQQLEMASIPATDPAVKEYVAHQPFKQELIDELVAKKETPTYYRLGRFIDLCRGDHVQRTSEINADAFTLSHVAGAYWRGDSQRPMLQRIYGLAFGTKPELDNYLALQAEAKKRDHRKLGQQLDLFTFSDLVGSGLPLYTPNGALIRRLLNDYVEEVQVKAGYTQVWTPQIAKAQLFKISGHYDKYREGMFRVKSNYSEEELYLKPMNCPQHTQIYASQPRSYRDLPLRYTDFAMLYRDEKPGELSGLARVRSFSQDDCHVFCREDQVDQEIDTALKMTKQIMKTFGLTYRYRLSTSDKAHPEKYIGDQKTWARLEAWAERIMRRNKIAYFDGPGEAAFYAPKMDLVATDALGRDWQLSTVQIDFFLPERFNLNYADKDGQDKRPVMIHRAIIGSPERFIMILLEHFAGAFPLWLSPVQVQLIPVSTKHLAIGRKLQRLLSDAGLRVHLDEANETVGYKIRHAEKQKVPYMVVLGDKERALKKLAIRVRGQKNVRSVSLASWLKDLRSKIDRRSLGL